MARKTLTDKAKRFVDEYLIDMNASAACIRAGYSAKSAKQIGCELLAKPVIAEAIAAAQAKRLERVEVDQDAILRGLLAAAHTDRNELTQFRRICCRYCYGEGHRYQRTAGEMERDQAAHRTAVAASKANPRLPKPGRFDRQGGVGYHKLKDPHPECPECFGEGVGETFIKDTRKLSAEARAVFEGIEQTKDGLKVRSADRATANTLLMRHAGMLVDKVDHTTKGAQLPSAATPAVINVTVGGQK